MTWLIPVRADRRESGVSPEVAARVQVRPGLISIFDQQIHLLADVDVTADTVLPRVDRLDRREDKVVRSGGVREWEELHNRKARRAQLSRRNLVAREAAWIHWARTIIRRFISTHQSRLMRQGIS